MRPALAGRYRIATRATEVNCRFVADFQRDLCAELLEYDHPSSRQWSVSTSTQSFIAAEAPMNQTPPTWLGVPGTGFDATVPVVGLLLLKGAEPAPTDGSSTTSFRVQVTTQRANRIHLLGVETLPATFAATVELGSGGSRIARVMFDLPEAQLTITYDEGKGVSLELPHPKDGSPVDVDLLRSLLDA